MSSARAAGTFLAVLACWTACWTGGPCSAAAAPDAEFEDTIAPLIARRCLGCHGNSEKKGGLDLTRLEAAQAGGDSGPALSPGKPDESLFWQRISREEMPPETPLPEVEKELLRAWIADGAAWPREIDLFRYTTDRRAGYDWWSLAPVRRPELPAVQDTAWPAGPIDRFILARLEASALAPAPAADRRTLVRRLTFDLLGLPPTPEETAAFVADDSPEAHERLVDRLLSSPHYGERWARHWLDIIRFGESQGFERDKLRSNAWPYRDWVIQALNDDLPYDEFVRLQLAGDVLRPDDPMAVVATGFLVAGAYDEVGQTQQSAAMRAVVRQDELEDYAAVVGQSFLGLTVNCARCHDHKFDPIFQREYYQLTAALSGVRHGERERLSEAGRAALHKERQRLEGQVVELSIQLAAIVQPVRDRLVAERTTAPPTSAPPEPIARWEFDEDLNDAIGGLEGIAHGHARLEGGRLVVDGTDSFVSTAPLPVGLKAKTLEAWVAVPNLAQQGGGVMSVETLDGQVFDAIVYGERDPRQWMAGSNGFTRTQSFAAPEESTAAPELVHVAIVYTEEGGITGYRNGIPYGTAYASSALQPFAAGECHVLFGLRHNPPGGNRFLAAGIERAQLYDRALSAEEVAASAGVAPSTPISDDDVRAALDAQTLRRHDELVRDISRLRLRQRLLGEGVTYLPTPREPDVAHVLARGNPQQPGDVARPGGVAAVRGESADFGLAADAPEADRRRKLAEWITHRDNPLFARVIVNRLWQHHFGQGLLSTPNDFGFNGARPTHPELLDWLAAELVARNWSLKTLHRQIVLSAAYRQAGGRNPNAAAVDADNRLLWRKSPVRLEAEAVRDAVLAVAGELNPTQGGPGYQDFRTFTFNSQFYEVQDLAGWQYNRRSVYRTLVRSGTNPLLDVLDCPDPSTTTPQRVVTTTPLQALALLNDSFILRMSDALARRLEREAGEGPAEQVRRANLLAYAREPLPEEVSAATEFVAQHGMSAFCRVIFNSNEFLYVD